MICCGPRVQYCSCKATEAGYCSTAASIAAKSKALRITRGKFVLSQLVELAPDKFSPIDSGSQGVLDLLERRLVKPHGQLACATTLADEVNDFGALLGVRS